MKNNTDCMQDDIYYTLRDDIAEIITYAPEDQPGVEHLVTIYRDGRVTFETSLPGYEGREFEVSSLTRTDRGMFVSGPGLQVSLVWQGVAVEEVV